jgi:mono/diheme cytochrome c family protein
MLRVISLLLIGAWVAGIAAAQDSQSILHLVRSSPGDLEVGGELAGLPPGSTRYVRYHDLLSLPQESYTVSDDTNFPHGARIGGVALSTLIQRFAALPQSALTVAICYDKYRTNYPRDYMAAHHPILVLRIDGKLRDAWPKSEHGGPLGPYLISHPVFKPSFKVLSHEDEPQIPYGVTRLEFRQESAVFGAIRPASQWRENQQVQQGYIIARQDCFRCHNKGAEGGTMAGSSWPKLGALAATDPRRFRIIIRDPASIKPDTKMPAQPGYDDATLDALAAYFRTFAGNDSHPETKPKP